MIFETQNLYVSYGAIEVLKDINIQVQDKEIISILGANGAGKSTLMKSISGIIPLNQGKVLYKGRAIHELSPNKIVKLGISQVPEGRQIFSSLQVIQNLTLGAYTLKEDKASKISKKLEYIFELFPILKERAKQKAGRLSGGEQQMLAIGRALMSEPQLLLFDEPSIGLAPIVVKNIMNVIQALNKSKDIPIILVEQNIEIALKISDRGYVLENGKIALRGSAYELLNDARVQQSYLGK